MQSSSFLQDFQGIPPEWIATRGKGVRVALIDSGAFLDHPALSHHNVPGRKFDMRLADPTGNDDVADASPVGSPHGTICAGIIGGELVNPIPWSGVAPDVELLIFRAADEGANPRRKMLVRAIERAIKENVDIISISYKPWPDTSIPEGAINALFKEIQDRQIWLTTALENTIFWEVFNALTFPGDRPEVFNVGSLPTSLLKTIPNGAKLIQGIHFLFPRKMVWYPNGGDLQEPQKGLFSSSIANATIAGILSLFLSFKRQKENNPSLKIPGQEALQALKSCSTNFSPEQMLADNTLQIYHNI